MSPNSYRFYAQIAPSLDAANAREWSAITLASLAGLGLTPIVGSSKNHRSISVDLECADTATPDELLSTAIDVLKRAATLGGMAVPAITHIDALHCELLHPDVSAQEAAAHTIDLTDLYLQWQLEGKI